MWFLLGQCHAPLWKMRLCTTDKEHFHKSICYRVWHKHEIGSLLVLSSLSRKEFSKTHQINLASLVHLANYTLHLANSNKFLINSLTDFFSLIQKTAKRASIFWNQKFPSALLDLKKIIELAPHCEDIEINALPLHRFYQQKPQGIERSKWIELSISYKSCAKIIQSHFNIDIEKPDPTPTDPRTLDPNIYKLI